jgi:DNA mismatch repair protein MLH1
MNSLPPENIDVNVHPTKNEVQFLFEDEVVKFVYNSVLESLNSAIDGKKFPVLSTPDSLVVQLNKSVDSMSSISVSSTSSKRIRSDTNQRKISNYFAPRFEQVTKNTFCSKINCNTNFTSQCGFCCKVEGRRMSLVSKRTSIDGVHSCGSRSNVDSLLLDVIEKSVYVGSVDSVFSVVQSRDDLWLLDHVLFMESFFYQIFMEGDLSFVCLPSDVKILPLMLSVLENSEQMGLFESLGVVKFDIAAQFICTELLKHGDVLRDFFSLSISLNGFLVTMPTILEVIVPSVENIPVLLLSLVLDVDWEDSAKCHKNVAEVMSRFYASSILLTRKVFENVVFPAAQCFYLPPPSCSDDDIIFRKIVSLDQLHKVFERC